MKTINSIFCIFGWFVGFMVSFTALYFLVAYVFRKNKATKETRNSFTNVHEVMKMVVSYGTCYFVLLLMLNGIKYFLNQFDWGNVKDIVSNLTTFALIIPEFVAKGLYGLTSRKTSKENFVPLNKDIETFVSTTVAVSVTLTFFAMGYPSVAWSILCTKIIVVIAKKYLSIKQSRVSGKEETWCLKGISPLVAVTTVMLNLAFISTLVVMHMSSTFVSMGVVYAFIFALVFALFVWGIATNILEVNEKEHKSIIKSIVRAVKKTQKKNKPTKVMGTPTIK